MPRQAKIESECGFRLLDVFQVADILGIHERTFRHMVAGGSAPAPIKVGVQSRWPQEVIETWIKAGCPRVQPQRHAWDVPQKRGRGRPRKSTMPAAASSVDASSVPVSVSPATPSPSFILYGNTTSVVTEPTR